VISFLSIKIVAVKAVCIVLLHYSLLHKSREVKSFHKIKYENFLSLEKTHRNKCSCAQFVLSEKSDFGLRRTCQSSVLRDLLRGSGSLFEKGLALSAHDKAQSAAAETFI